MDVNFKVCLTQNYTGKSTGTLQLHVAIKQFLPYCMGYSDECVSGLFFKYNLIEHTYLVFFIVQHTKRKINISRRMLTNHKNITRDKSLDI